MPGEDRHHPCLQLALIISFFYFAEKKKKKEEDDDDDDMDGDEGLTPQQVRSFHVVPLQKSQLTANIQFLNLAFFKQSHSSTPKISYPSPPTFNFFQASYVFPLQKVKYSTAQHPMN